MPNREILASPDIAESEEGAVLLNSGYTALGKVMAGSGGIQFTKAELDSGDLPEGTAVEDLTAPVEYAGDAMIAKCENTGTGEATVVVQATSVGVETGFYVKGVMLYIKDPEGDGDVAYSYLPLQSKPEWMRPQGSPVNKMVTFNIINIVGAAASVSAIIDPDALARVVDLEKYALLGHSHEISDVSGLANTLSDHAAAIDLLNDLVSGDMPGGINKTADFATPRRSSPCADGSLEPDRTLHHRHDWGYFASPEEASCSIHSEPYRRGWSTPCPCEGPGGACGSSGLG